MQRRFVLGKAVTILFLARATPAGAQETQPPAAVQPSTPPATAEDYSWQRRLQLERPSVIRNVAESGAPAGYEAQTRYDSRRVITGSVALGLGYLMTVGASFAAERTEVQNFVPCVGPFIDTGPIPSGDGFVNTRGFAIYLLALTGCALELTGTIELVRALMDPRPVFVRSGTASSTTQPRFILRTRPATNQVTFDAGLRF